MLDKIVFRQSQVILLFSSACFFDIISSMYPQDCKVLLTLILGGNSKSRVFENDNTLSLASFQFEHPLDEAASFILILASVGRWLHRNRARAYCRTTTAKHYSAQASLSRMRVGGTEKSWAELEQAGHVYP